MEFNNDGLFARRTDADISNRLNIKNGNKYSLVEYECSHKSGSKGTSNGWVYLYCNDCGNLFRHTDLNLRPSAKKNITCHRCQTIVINADHKEQEREKLKQKELAELKAIKSSVQVEWKFNKCIECGRYFIPSKLHMSLCSERCRKHKANRIATKRKESRFDKPRRQLLTWYDVFMATKSLRCQGCGIVCDPDSDGNADNHPSIDHIIPVSKGGADTMENVQIMCRRCNTLKGNSLTYPQYTEKALKPIGPMGAHPFWRAVCL